MMEQSAAGRQVLSQRPKFDPAQATPREEPAQ